MGNAVTMSNQDIKTLMERWGFQQERQNGHIIMKHGETGQRVQLSTTKITPHVALKKAAGIVGVTLTAFKSGPAKKPGTRRQPKHVVEARLELDRRLADEWVVPLELQPELQPEAEPIPPASPRSEPVAPKGRPSELVYAALRERPDRPIASKELVRLTGCTPSQVGSALQNLRRIKPEEVVAVKPGVHRFVAQEVDEAEVFAPVDRSWEDGLDSSDVLVRLQAVQARLDAEVEIPKRRIQRQIVAGLEVRTEPPPPPPTCFQLVGSDRTGRMLLRDEGGEMFMATRTFRDIDQTPFLT